MKNQLKLNKVEVFPKRGRFIVGPLKKDPLPLLHTQRKINVR